MEKEINKKILKYNFTKNTYSLLNNKEELNVNFTLNKICIILDSAMHNPPLAGLPKRVFDISKGFNSKGINVTWIICNRNFSEQRNFSDFNVSFAKVYILNDSDFYDQIVVSRILKEEGIQVVQFEVVQTFLKLGPGIKEATGIPLVLEVHDVDSVLSKDIKTSSTFEESMFLQSVAAHLCDAMVVISSKDMLFFKEELSINFDKAFLAPNVVDIKDPEEFEKIYDVVFLGNMFYEPNMLGFNNFFTNIKPKIEAALERRISVLVVGMYNNNSIINFDDSVNFVGPVKDDKKLTNMLSSSRVGVCPILFGSGMKVKILDYSAASLPIVTTSIGAFGYDEIKNLVIEDDFNKFAEAVTDFILNEEFAKSVGIKNAQSVRCFYSFESIFEKLISAYTYAHKMSNLKGNEIPKPFWMSEKRHLEKVLEDSYVLTGGEFKKL